MDRFLERYPELTAAIAPPDRPGVRGRNLLAILDENRLRRMLARMLDPDEFLSDYGIRALSRYHRDHPYVFTIGDQVWRVGYEPAE